MTETKVAEHWKQRARKLKMEVYSLYFAYRDPRIPWYAKLFIAVVVAYAFSPIDLIPDFIPVLGYLDDLLLIPLGVTLAIKMIPDSIMDEARKKTQALNQKPKSWAGAALVVSIWIVLVAMIVYFIFSRFINKN